MKNNLRTFWISLCLSAFAAGCYRQDIRTLIVDVPQMRSTECVKIVQNALSSVDGILTVQPDVSSHTLAVTYDSRKLGIKNIEYVITAAGFDANQSPGKPEVRDQLPESCR
ncbi:MAG: heavy-metal-associated domain-containing protein [Kiritimatiellae bacterium]|nr:heavy-metal-associated domain-containing protein [Kiritimatiellia bacterium]